MKRQHENRSCPCICDRCNAVAVSTPDSTHRRCAGKLGAKPAPKHAPTQGRVRGKWAAA